jgi:serine O-acetyltransferase
LGKPADRFAARALMREIRRKHPRLRDAIVADARVAAVNRAERSEFRSKVDTLGQILRLMWVTDALFAQTLYRLKARLQALRFLVLPRLLHRWAMASAQVCIGDPVIIDPGLYLAHGQVVIDGIVEIQRGAVIFPFVTIGVRAGNFRGPTIGPDVHIGTGARVIGPITLGAGVQVGANAVVVDDVPQGATVTGVPAQIVGQGRPK